MHIYNHYYHTNPKQAQAIRRLLEGEEARIAGLIANAKNGDELWENGKKVIWDAEVKRRAEDEVKELKALASEL